MLQQGAGIWDPIFYGEDPGGGQLTTYSSVLRLDQPNYYAYFYLKESICSMYMKLSRKFVISVVINLPKNFASHFWSRDPK